MIRIAVLGNLAAGKTTLCKQLAQETGFVFLNLDTFRQQAALRVSHPRQVESLAQKKLLDALAAHATDPIIFETTASGFFHKQILQNYDWIKIKLKLDFEICQARFRNRKNYMPARAFKSDFETSFFTIQHDLDRIKADAILDNSNYDNFKTFVTKCLLSKGFKLSKNK